MNQFLSPDEYNRLFPNASNSSRAENLKAWLADRRESEAVKEGSADPAHGTHLVRDERQNPVMEPPAGDPAQGPDGPQEVRATRYLVRLTSYRCRLLDDDNFCSKFHIDTLRYCGFIPEDAPGICKIEPVQKQVRTRLEEKTKIEIFPPGTWSEVN